ncbi:hypothetical protein PC128_g14191 [Phytophthora cactorum]|nr:hypothetical protein PC128_g14191 [Phytophthora cactorum]
MMEANDLWEITILHETPPRSGSLHDEGAFWCRERKAKAFLLETLTDELVVSVGTKRCAYEVLEYIEQTYAAKNWGNLVTLRETFISSKYEDGQEMTAHLNKLKTVADKLAHQGETVDDKERVCQATNKVARVLSICLFYSSPPLATADHGMETGWQSILDALMANRIQSQNVTLLCLL